MKRWIAGAAMIVVLAACGGNEKAPESTYGSTSTIPNTTDTTQTSTGGPGAQPSLATTDTTNTRYGGTTVTDTSSTTNRGTP